MGSYTARELERDTGFGRRTIAYYVQEGLLPRVGRRGPRTRYPELVRDRLLFIRRVREVEAEGEIAPVPLSDLRKLFLHAPRQLIASVAAGETPVTDDMVSPMSVERSAMVDRVSALRERLSARREAPADDFSADFLRLEAPRSPRFRAEEGLPALEPPKPPAEAGVADPEPRLSWVLEKLQTQARRHRRLSPETVDTWSQVEVTPEIRLSVRGMADEDAFLLRLAARLLRQALAKGPPPVERGSRERDE